MKEYLGDSVYAEFDGDGINLTTENGFGPTNTVYLEPRVFLALNRFAKRIREMIEEETDNATDPRPT